MKWISNHSAAALAAVALLAGCVNTSPEARVRNELADDGGFYLKLDTAPLHRRFGNWLSAAERGIAESSMPNPERESAQGLLALFRATADLAGVPEIAAVGAGSSRDADGYFTNRIAVAAGERHDGWIWRMHGEKRPRIAEFSALPASTVFAAAFGTDFQAVVDELTSGDDGGMFKTPHPQLFMMSPAELLKTLSGEWLAAVAVPPGTALNDFEKYDLMLSIPDRDEALSRRISGAIPALLPGARRTGNVIYMPETSGAAPVLVLLPHRVLFFSSPRSFDTFCSGRAEVDRNGKFVPGSENNILRHAGKSLSGEFILTAAPRLYESSHGAYFIDTTQLKHNFTLGGKNGVEADLDFSAAAAVGTWRIEDGMIRLREVSTEELSAKVFDLTAGFRLLMLADAWLTPPAAAAPSKKTEETAKKAAVREKLRAENAACRVRLERMRRQIADYSKTHQGKLPAALPPGSHCGKDDYVYFGPFGTAPCPKFPLVADPPRGSAHPGTVNILFVDGTIRSFEFSADTLKRLCSYLHTIYRYNEQELLQLIERASQLDELRTKKP